MVYQFWLPFVLIWIIIMYLNRRSGVLRDMSAAVPAPFSWSRVQLAWWTAIILSSLIAIIWKDMQDAPPANIPTLHYSTLVLLGISAATTTVARLIDVSDLTDNNPAPRHQDQGSVNVMMDVLSDQDGVSIHRLQAVIFNLIFGVWFIGTVLYNLAPGHDPCSLYAAGSQLATACNASKLDYMMPVISDNNLILLGLSSATYAAMKTTENKAPVNPVTATTPPPPVQAAGVTGIAANTASPATTTVTTATNVTTTP